MIGALKQVEAGRKAEDVAREGTSPLLGFVPLHGNATDLKRRIIGNDESSRF